MKSAGRDFFTLFSCAAVLWGGGHGAAFAASGDLFGQAAEPDVAQAWLGLLFRGIPLPAGLAGDAPNLDAMAGALHRALGVYSMSILVLAGLLLFYNLAIMIIETAHYGVPLGRRSSQIWAPIRLVLAIGFLVPVSGGLNAGQYLVTWMAEQGSSLASRAWSIAAIEMKGSFSGIAPPHGPDVAGFVAGGLDMELCRSLYRRAFAGVADTNTAVRLAGDIGDIEKMPPSRFAGETWQYSNRLHAAMPLCGAWRFTAARTATGDVPGAGTVERLNNEFADFSRLEADKLIGETQTMAENNAGAFLGESQTPSLHDEIAALIVMHQAEVDERLHALAADDPGLIDQTLATSANAGWITAGGFLLELARLQQIYSTLAAHALPTAQPPLLAESNFLHLHLAETVAADPDPRSLAAADITPLTSFETQMSHTAHLAHAWLYDRQLADMPLMLADPSDLHDEMTAANDPSAVSSLFGHVLNDAAIANGVWNNRAAVSSPLAVGADKSVLTLPSLMQNPVTALAEFGQRQVALGNYLFGIAGPDMAPAGTLAHTILLGAAGLGFMASGFALMLLVPLLPFIRFFVGILAWLLSVFEAVIAVPVVALAHLNLHGEGLSGGAARQAYLLWLNILIRPALILFGLIAGLLLFTFAIAFLDLVFHQLMHLAAPANGEGFVTINVGLTILYTVLAVAAANVSFKGITFLPEMALKWLGGMHAAERAEAPTAVSAAPGAAGLPGLSPARLLAQRDNGRTRGELENKIMAAAKSYGMALFPQYRGGEKSGADAPKPGEASGRHEHISSPGDPSRLAPLTGLKNPNRSRGENRLDKGRKGNADNLNTGGVSGLDKKTEVSLLENAKPNAPEREPDCS